MLLNICLHFLKWLTLYRQLKKNQRDVTLDITLTKCHHYAAGFFSKKKNTILSIYSYANQPQFFSFAKFQVETSNLKQQSYMNDKRDMWHHMQQTTAQSLPMYCVYETIN